MTMVFRRLGHVPSPYFKNRQILSAELIKPFYASRYMMESAAIKGAVIEPNDDTEIKEAAGRAFLFAQKELLDKNEAAMPPTGQERQFFFETYPLLMVRDAAIMQAEAILLTSNPEIQKNAIKVCKKNLTRLYAVLENKKPISIVRSARRLDILKDSATLDFGKYGTAFAAPLDNERWLISMSDNVLASASPDVFFTDNEKAGELLGFPRGSIRSYVYEKFLGSDLIYSMLHFDMEIDHLLWDSVFIPAVMPDGDISDAHILKDWHDCLARAIPEDAMGLLLLESKINTLARIAYAVACAKDKVERLLRAE